MDGFAAGVAGLSGRDPIGWWASFDRPLKALPRWAAAIALLLTIASLAWSVVAVSSFRTEDGGSSAITDSTSGFGDLDLYEAISRRVQSGEHYYSAALTEQRTHGYPARPFVVVRTPIMAWGASLWGEGGWRGLALALLLANAVAWYAAVSSRATAVERIAAPVLVFAGGLAVFNARYAQVHDLIAGLFVSLALALYRPDRWWPTWLLAAAALAVRELALPFVLLWATFALTERRWREFAAVLALLALFALGMALHAQGVAEARLPTDRASLGWSEMLGPHMFVTSVSELTPLLVLPPAVAAPLALLPLLGWLGLGGRTGLFAILWFAGFALALSILARSGNFYWALLVLPAYAGGLAFAPRALADLVAALGKPQLAKT